MKLSMKTQLSYGIGQAGDTIPYCMFYTFFLYFLTDVAGIGPAMAGMIALGAVCLDAVTAPVCGYLSDNLRTKHGRRRPMMAIGILPLSLTIFLIFAPLPISGVIANFYYLIMAAMFWIFYNIYVIPYMSLGGEMTTDYNGRNNIRMYNMIGGGIFMLLCTSGPMYVLDRFLSMGYSERFSWGISGAVFGVITLVCAMICLIATKGKENESLSQVPERNRESISVVLKEIFQIPSYRRLCLMTVMIVFGFIIASTALVYLLTYNCGLDEAQQSLYWIIYAVIYTAAVPIGSSIANKYDKKKAFLLGNIIAVFAMAYFAFAGISSFSAVIVYTVFYQLASTVFWTMYITFAYDVSAIDEYKNGKFRAGSIIAIVSFCQKFGSAVAMYATGSLLAIVGYNGEAAVQSQQALDGINLLCTVAPAAGCFIAVAVMVGYPVSRKKYDALIEALDAKKEGKDFSEKEFADLVKSPLAVSTYEA